MAERIEYVPELLNVDYEKYLSQHDVVYLSPATEGIEGMPIGNGDMAAMVWTPPEQIIWNINKCDLWDDGPDGNFEHWKKDWEEKATRLVGAGRLIISNGLPSYDWRYLKDFESRLRMYQGQVSTRSETPFSSTQFDSFISKSSRCLVVDYHDQLEESVSRQISLRRWGSRKFAHFYHQILRDPSVGLDGTESGCDRQHVWIVQKTRSITFAVACRVVGIEFDTRQNNSRDAVFDTAATDKADFQVYLSVVTSEEDTDPLAAALKLVDDACEKGLQGIREEHRGGWQKFWDRSFVSIPDKYVENLWYFQSYQMASCNSGRYPVQQSGGLWFWNGNIQAWNFFYHWNIQQYAYPMHSCGQFDMFEPYARFRRNGLVHAMEDAKKAFNCRGAWYADIANRKGYQPIVFQDDVEKKSKPDEIQVDHGTTDNLTPGPQISMDLYRHYQYTLDEDFLRNCAYPVMRECVRFYCDYLKKEDDGLYHIPQSCPYEGNGLCKDSVTDLACIRQLFPAFLETARHLDTDEQLSKEAGDALDNLADYVIMEMPEGVVSKGMEDSPGPILAAGINLEEQGGPYHQWLPDSPDKIRVVFGTVHVAPIFPASLIGLDQKGSEEFEIMERTLRCFDPQSIGGFLPYLPAYARMGTKDVVWSEIIKWAENYQAFSQGFFSEQRRNTTFDHGVMNFCATYAHPSETWEVEVIGGETDETTQMQKQPFVYMAMEPGAILQAAINEILLQSYSGRIRVFPAAPDDWTGCFVLHAVGGFVVAGEKRADGISHVNIVSRKGKRCRLVNPWYGSEPVIVYDTTSGEEILTSTNEQEISFDTSIEHVYHIKAENAASENTRGKVLTGQPNKCPKKLDKAVIGKPKLF